MEKENCCQLCSSNKTKERSEQDEHMLALLTHDKSYVSEENTDAFMEWYASQT